MADGSVGVGPFHPAATWVTMFNARHAVVRNAQSWPATGAAEVFECIVCLDASAPRSHFEATGFACVVCRDGVVCRACARRIADGRRTGEAFNTLKCPACKQTSYTYACLTCHVPLRPGGDAVQLVKEFVGVDKRMVQPMEAVETLEQFVITAEAVGRMLQLQVRVRASFMKPYEPCMPHLNALWVATTTAAQAAAEPATVQSTVLTVVKTAGVRALRALWPLLCWTHVVGAVCADDDDCRCKFTECGGCGFLVRTASPHAGAACSHCRDDYSASAP